MYRNAEEKIVAMIIGKEEIDLLSNCCKPISFLYAFNLIGKDFLLFCITSILLHKEIMLLVQIVSCNI